MFLRNHTSTPAVCTRGTLDLGDGAPARAFTTVATCEAFVLSGGLAPLEVSPPPLLTPVLRSTILDGTGVTLTGEIGVPAPGSLATRIALRVGATERTLVARGTRRWVRSGSALVPSHPEPWTPLEMHWSEAFGGTDILTAGKDPLSGLPRPRVTVADPRNPSGKGFALSSTTAEGQPLPRLELLHDQIERWVDLTSKPAPTPGCFAPCTDAPAMTVGTAFPRERVPRPHPMLAAHQVAPWYLVFPTLAPGARVVLTGMGDAVDFAVPPSRVELRAAGKPRGARVGTRLRALHIDAPSQRAFAVWHHVVCTSGATPDLRLRNVQRGDWS